MTTLALFRDYLVRHRKMSARLRSFLGVHHADVGYRYVDGARTGSLAVRLFIVGEKRPRSQAKTYHLAPRSLGGVPLDVIPFAPQRHAARVGNGASGALVGGVSIGGREGRSVTLGAVVRSSSFPGLQALTSDEVGDLGDTVFCPGAGIQGATAIGQATPPSRQNACSLVSLGSVDSIEDRIQGLPSLSGIVEAPELDRLCVASATVRKSGAKTGVTRGTLDGREDETGTVTITPADGPLADGGDCGSIWMTPDGRGVALHYAGEGSRALAQSMHRVRDTLGLLVG